MWVGDKAKGDTEASFENRGGKEWYYAVLCFPFKKLNIRIFLQHKSVSFRWDFQFSRL